MKNYGVKSEIYLDHYLKTQMIMMKKMKIKFNSDIMLPHNSF